MTDSQPHQSNRLPVMLLSSACLVFFASLVYRAFYFMELSGTVCYEMEAATRIIGGRMPYYDFYFDQPLLSAYMRIPSVILARLFADLAGSREMLVVTPFWSRALSSYIITALTAVLSFLLCFYVVISVRLSQKSLRSLAAALVGYGLANFAMGFVFGCAQHVFCLLLTPYLFLRAIRWAGAKPAIWLPIICGVLAGLGAGMSPLFLPVILLVEVTELLSTRFQKRKPPVEFWALLAAYALSWTWILTLSSAALAELDDWIIPLKIASLHLDQIAFYGSGSTPDRRSVIYLCSAVMISCFGLTNRAPLLRPLATVMMCGFSIYLSTMTGLSSELSILIWSMCLALSVIAIILIDGALLANFARRYPYLTYREARVNRVKVVLFALFCLAALGIMAGCETMERRENIAVAVGPQALDPDFIDIETALVNYSKPDQKVLILNGRLLPTFPIYARVNRQICGYYLSSEPLSTVANIQDHSLTDQVFGKPFGWLAKVKAKLYSRIGAEIQIQKPAVILVEGGQTYDKMKDMGILAIILKDYTAEGEGRYHSWSSGAKEFADWNYRYNIFRLKK